MVKGLLGQRVVTRRGDGSPRLGAVVVAVVDPIKPLQPFCRDAL
jgi:hypothetical protein